MRGAYGWTLTASSIPSGHETTLVPPLPGPCTDQEGDAPRVELDGKPNSSQGVEPGSDHSVNEGRNKLWCGDFRSLIEFQKGLPPHILLRSKTSRIRWRSSSGSAVIPKTSGTATGSSAGASK